MNQISKVLSTLVFVAGVFQLTGCSVMSMHAASTRIENTRSANAGKQLVPKDGGTYLIPVGYESASYLGSADTDWKVNNTSFTQPRGTYSVVRALSGTYTVYGNKRVAGGGEASSSIELKEGESVCFYPVNPLSAPARIETYKGDACDPILRILKNQNVIEEVK